MSAPRAALLGRVCATPPAVTSIRADGKDPASAREDHTRRRGPGWARLPPTAPGRSAGRAPAGGLRVESTACAGTPEPAWPGGSPPSLGRLAARRPPCARASPEGVRSRAPSGLAPARRPNRRPRGPADPRKRRYPGGAGDERSVGAGRARAACGRAEPGASGVLRGRGQVRPGEVAWGTGDRPAGAASGKVGAPGERRPSGELWRGRHNGGRGSAERSAPAEAAAACVWDGGAQGWCILKRSGVHGNMTPRAGSGGARVHLHSQGEKGFCAAPERGGGPGRVRLGLSRWRPPTVSSPPPGKRATRVCGVTC